MQKGSNGRFSFLFIGESTGLPPMWPRRRPHLWVEFVVSSCPCSERFFSGYDCFRLSSNQHFQITIQSGMHGLTSSWVPSIPQNSGLKFWKFHVPNKTAHSGCTDPTQATARLVIVLVSKIKKNSTGDNNFVKWKGTFRSDRPK